MALKPVIPITNHIPYLTPGLKPFIPLLIIFVFFFFFIIYLFIFLLLFFFYNSETIKIRQAQVDKLYAGLKDLAEERRGKLDETLKLYQLNREIDDLELWIADKEVVAGSQDIGQDLAQVEVYYFYK